MPSWSKISVISWW